MTTDTERGTRPRAVDKQELRRLLAEQDRRTGFVVDREITAQGVRAMMVSDGIRPEDNEFSRDILCMREGDRE